MLVYLAGPEVFLPDPHAVFAARRDACARHGLVAVTPFDDLPDEPPGWASLPAASRIARRNEAHIRRAAAVIANLTPFRGVSADAGTVYEVGFARALGRPVFAFSNVAATYEQRVLAWAGLAAGGRDRDDMEIEGFGLADNLMIACGIEPDGAWLTATAGEEGAVLFERCAALAAAWGRAGR